jgi:DNA-binding NtrC family response regulator
LEVIHAMSSDEASLHLPNIFISVYDDFSNTLEAMTLGCWTVLQKPIDIGLLRHTVDDACHWSRTNRRRIAIDCEARRVWSTINEKALLDDRDDLRRPAE